MARAVSTARLIASGVAMLAEAAATEGWGVTLAVPWQLGGPRQEKESSCKQRQALPSEGCGVGCVLMAAAVAQAVAR